MQTIRVGRQVAIEMQVATRKLYLDLLLIGHTLNCAYPEKGILGLTQEWARNGGVQYEKTVPRRIRPKRVALA